MIKIILTILIALIITACPPPPRKAKKAVVIFCDVTSSLHSAETEKTAQFAADILDRLPLDTEYVVYPVQIETERPEAVVFSDKSKTIGENSDTHSNEDPERRAQITSGIKSLFDEVNKVQPPDRTCLLNTLSLAKAFFSDLDPNKYEFELVFISDMIEQCSNIGVAPNKSVDLQKQEVDTAISLIQNSEFPDLSNVRVSVIIPGTKERTMIKNKPDPSLESLRKFWSVVFKKSKNEAAAQIEWHRNEVPLTIAQPQRRPSN
jgi:hypothetical protein